MCGPNGPGPIRPHPFHLVPLLLLAAAVLAPGPARAFPAFPAPSSAAWICTDGPVSDIFVDNNSVFDVGSPGLDARFNWAYRLANRLHVRTRESVIRRELLFRVGDCFDPALLEDSERILRSLPFIAEADVYGVQQADSSYHVVVETRDEWSFRLEPEFESGDGAAVTGLSIREDNLFGTGQRVSAFYREDYGRRVYGAAYGTQQLLGTRLDAEIALERTAVGTGFAQRVAYPFRGEAGRWAVRQQFSHEDRYFEYFREDGAGRLRPYLFQQRRRGFDLGTVFRIGRRGNLTLFGVGLAGEWITYPDGGALVPRDRDAPPIPEGDSLTVRLDSVSNVRLVFLAGQRNVRFDRRRALDAVRGTEDVVLGAEVELGVGRSLTQLSDDDDVQLDLGIFAAGDVGPVLTGSRLVLRAQRDLSAPLGTSEWRNLFGQVDAWGYWRPSPDSRQTWVAAFTGVGGWNVDIPYQVTLGSRAGLRGLARHRYTGERRAVATLEQRTYWGWPARDLFDLGSAVFVDVGRSWAGEGPFGDDSPWEVTAGVGLRGAFPPNSRRTYRVDVATPLTGSAFGSVRVSLGVGQAVGRGAVRDDRQLRRSAQRGLSASVFSFP